MAKLVDLSPRPHFMLWVRYDDGSEGEVDLSDLAGRGVFAAWNDATAFQKAYIGPQGQPSWGDEIELCPDAIYMRLTGKSPEEVFPALKKTGASA